MQQLRDVVQNDAVDLKTRQQALKSLIDAEPDDLRQLCESLLNVRVLNATAAQGLAQFDDPEIARLLARRYRRFHPDDRPSVIEKLVSRPTFARVLLDEIEAGSAALKASDLSAAHARQIRSLGDSQLNARLRDVWGELRDSSTDRLAAIAALKQQLPASVLQQADLSTGRALFNRTCAACHQLFGEGKKVGPDLTGSQRTNPDYLLGNILDPSAVVGKDYRMSIVAMEDGRVLNGLVVSQDARTLTLQTATQQVTINVADIEEVQQSSLSAMPDGLLNSLNETEIRDLIAYLQSPVQVPLK
jgi:putative heme-binding domain-containing protein